MKNAKGMLFFYYTPLAGERSLYKQLPTIGWMGQHALRAAFLRCFDSGIEDGKGAYGSYDCRQKSMPAIWLLKAGFEYRDDGEVEEIERITHLANKTIRLEPFAPPENEGHGDECRQWQDVIWGDVDYADYKEESHKGDIIRGSSVYRHQHVSVVGQNTATEKPEFGQKETLEKDNFSPD